MIAFLLSPAFVFVVIMSAILTHPFPDFFYHELSLWTQGLTQSLSSFAVSVPPVSWLLIFREEFWEFVLARKIQTCELVPQWTWSRWPIHYLECEKLLHPWWWAFKQWLATFNIALLVAVVLTTLSAALVLGHFATSLELLLIKRRFRFFRWRLAWWIGRQRRTTIFCPVSPAGMKDDAKWTIDPNGTTCTWRDGELRKLEPLPLKDCLMNVPGILWGQYTAHVTHTYALDHLTLVWDPKGSNDEGEVFEERTPTLYPIKRVFTGNGMDTWLTTADSYMSVKFNETEWTIVLSMLDAAGKDTQIFSVETLLASLNTGHSREELKMLSAYMTLQWNKKKRQFPQCEESLPRQVLEAVGDVRDDPTAPFRTTGRRVLPDFTTHPDSMPCTGRQGDIAAIHYRLDICRNKILTFDVQLRQSFSEFVDMVCGNDVIAPWDLQALLDHQNGPRQRVRNERDKWDLGLMAAVASKCKAMLKIEAIVNRNAVRNISTVNGVLNLPLGCYLLACSAHLKKKFKWYAAGKTPDQIGERMVEIVSQALSDDRSVCAADVSKMDAGKHPEIMAWVTTRIYLRLFGVQEELLLRLRAEEHKIKSTTNTGVTYVNGASQMSGSSSTTIDNTLTSAYMSYLGYRFEGYEPREAFNRLGAYCGDDSVSLNTAAAMEAVGQELGYTIKADMKERGEDVPFLSRDFYHVWQGGKSSLQDPVRLMRKIALSIAPKEVGAREAAVAKLKGLAGLEPGNLLYQELYAAAVRLTGLDPEVREDDMSYMQRHFVTEGGWDVGCDWAAKWEEKTKVSPFVYIDWAKSCKSWQQFLEGPRILIDTKAPPKPVVACNPLDPTEFPIPENTNPVAVEATTAVPNGPPPQDEAVAQARGRERQAERALNDMARRERRVQAARDRRQAAEEREARLQRSARASTSTASSTENIPRLLDLVIHRPAPPPPFVVGRWVPEEVEGQ